MASKKENIVRTELSEYTDALTGWHQVIIRAGKPIYVVQSKTTGNHYVRMEFQPAVDRGKDHPRIYYVDLHMSSDGAINRAVNIWKRLTGQNALPWGHSRDSANVTRIVAGDNTLDEIEQGVKTLHESEADMHLMGFFTQEEWPANSGNMQTKLDGQFIPFKWDDPSQEATASATEESSEPLPF